MNRKRVHRLWKRNGLRVPVRQSKKRRLGSGENACSRRKPERRNDVRAWDFLFDRTEDGRALKFLTVVDEFTRECVALEVARHFTAHDVKRTIARADLRGTGLAVAERLRRIVQRARARRTAERRAVRLARGGRVPGARVEARLRHEEAALVAGLIDPGGV